MKKAVQYLSTTTGLFACCLFSTPQLYSQRAVWEGEAALKAHREEVKQNRSRRSGESNEGAGASSTQQADEGGSVVTAKASPTGKPAPVRALTSAQIQAAREAAQKARAERKAKAMQEPLIVSWPSGIQPELKWEKADIELDNYTVSQTSLQTPGNHLVSETLVGYHPVQERSANTGLTLVNRVRSDLTIDYYTFDRNALLPDLEPESLDAYVDAVASTFEGRLVQPVDLEKAKQAYGPSAADLNTRRVTYQIVERSESGGESIVTAVVTDYLLPFKDEWLVIRFTAPPQLYKSARAPIESYLLNMSKVEPSPEFSSL